MAATLILLALAALALGECTLRGGPDPAWSRLARHVARPGRHRPGGGLLARMDRRLVRARVMASLERHLHAAGIPLTLSEALSIVIGGTALLAALAGAFRGPAAAGLVGAACPFIAWRMLAEAQERRIRRLDLQLPVALDILIGQLRAHHSVAEALAEAAHQAADPLRAEFARVAEEIRFGAPLSQALDALRRRTPSEALGTVITAILVSERTGANLVEFLVRQSRAVRARLAFRQEVRALSAHARSTATILTLLPAGVAVALYLLNPRFFVPMLAPGLGRVLLACAGAMEVGGWHVIRGMIRSVER